MSERDTVPSKRSFEEDLNMEYYTEPSNNNVLDNYYIKLELENKYFKKKIKELANFYENFMHEQRNRIEEFLKEIK